MILFLKIFAVVVSAFVGLPILTYLIVKFGVAAYYREKQKQTDNQDQ